MKSSRQKAESSDEQGTVTTHQYKVHTQPGPAAVQMFAANDRINQILIEHLDPAAWRAKPPGKARTVAAIFTHMHNVRSKWVRLSAPHLNVPRQLNRAHCTPTPGTATIGSVPPLKIITPELRFL